MSGVFVLGSFNADTAYRAARLPAWGETLMGSSFALGPGGKGSNQAVAAARAGGAVKLCSSVGDDAFGKMAREMWQSSGVDDSLVTTSDVATGAAAILLDEVTGENAIIIAPGANFTVTPERVQEVAAAIASAAVFLTQLELPLAAVDRGLALAHAAGVRTILNPAPAAPLTVELLALADFLIPNETEAAMLSGLPVESLDEAEVAARKLQSMGARNVILTLGARGALVLEGGAARPVLVPAVSAGAVYETTGAGDAFCGGFATALAEGQPVLDAVRFGCATAGISVTRAGTAPSMPHRAEIDAMLKATR